MKKIVSGKAKSKFKLQVLSEKNQKAIYGGSNTSPCLPGIVCIACPALGTTCPTFEDHTCPNLA